MRSEAAVSQQIKLLEIAVGARVLERVPGRPIRLTEAGRRLFATCESVLQHLEGTLGELEALGRLEQGQVVVGAGTYFGSYLLPPIYASFQRLVPGVRTLLFITNSTTSLAALRQGEIDLAIVGGGIEDDGLTGTQLAQKDLVWIAPRDHGLARVSNIPLGTLNADRLILSPGASPKRKSLDKVAAESGVTLQAKLELRGVEAQVTAVRGGLGIAAVPYHVMSRYEGTSLGVLSVEGFPLRTSWSLVWRAHDLSPAATAFRDHLLSHTTQIEAASLVNGARVGAPVAHAHA
jgi:DNA-binding transcriptional LysR family regulator